MATSTIVPLSEYLSTSYRPDCDWIDGEVKERSVGERQHASVQKFFIRYFGRREEELDILVWPAQRVQVSSTRFRVPDVTVTRASDPNEAIVTVAPLLCIEILSKDDRMSEIEERSQDYLAMGVPMVWIVEPKNRLAFQKSGMELESVEVLTLPSHEVQVATAEVLRSWTAWKGSGLKTLLPLGLHQRKIATPDCSAALRIAESSVARVRFFRAARSTYAAS